MTQSRSVCWAGSWLRAGRWAGCAAAAAVALLVVAALPVAAVPG